MYCNYVNISPILNNIKLFFKVNIFLLFLGGFYIILYIFIISVFPKSSIMRIYGGLLSEEERPRYMGHS